MDQQDKFSNAIKSIHKTLALFSVFVVAITCLLVYVIIDPNFSAFNSKEEIQYTVIEEVDEDLIENGIHVRTGLIEDEGLMTVVYNCTNCHSAKIVIQNRMSAERWASTIDWMQETQNLWDLGPNEDIIIDYLVTNYPPSKKGRRQALANIEWYELE